MSTIELWRLIKTEQRGKKCTLCPWIPLLFKSYSIDQIWEVDDQQHSMPFPCETYELPLDFPF